ECAGTGACDNTLEVKSTCDPTVAWCAAATGQNRLAEKRGCSTTVAPLHSAGSTHQEKPTTWNSGRDTWQTSSGRRARCKALSLAPHSRLACVHPTPLGVPVVPVVNRIIAGRIGSGAIGAAGSP